MPRILPYLRPYRKLAVISVILTILLAVVALAEPWPLAFVIDSIIGHKPVPSWLPTPFGTGTGGLIALAVIATLLLTALSGLMTVWNEYLSTTVDQKMVLDFRSDMFDHAQKLSLAFHDTESKGILMYRINNQASVDGRDRGRACRPLAQSLLTVIGMAYISIQINPVLAAAGARYHPVRRLLDDVLHQPHRATPVPRTGLGRDQSGDRLRGDVDDPRRPRVRNPATRVEAVPQAGGERSSIEIVGLTVRQTAFKSAVQLIASAGTAAVIGVGAYQAVNHQITAGELLVVLSYVSQIYQPLEELTTTITNFQQQFIVAADVVRSDGHPARRDREAERAAADASARRARARQRLGSAISSVQGVLKDISLRIPSGRGVAVVGPTGAGKSTLASLLPRFYDAEEGQRTAGRPRRA